MQKTNLCEDAGFKVKIYPDVYWVPVNCLGKTHYNNEYIRNKIIHMDLLEKRKKITNLYEAIQLLQIGDFLVMDDNYYVEEEGRVWEYHRKGKEVYINNQGGCASVASWLCFVLEKCYDEIGFISISSLSGNGHAVNYIINHGELYVIDLFSMANKFLKTICCETGRLSDYRRTKIPTSVLLNVKDFSAFANFFSRYMYYRSEEYAFFKHNRNYCVPISTIKKDDVTYIIFKKHKDVEIIWQKKELKKIKVLYAEDLN